MPPASVLSKKGKSWVTGYKGTKQGPGRGSAGPGRGRSSCAVVGGGCPAGFSVSWTKPLPPCPQLPRASFQPPGTHMCPRPGPWSLVYRLLFGPRGGFSFPCPEQAQGLPSGKPGDMVALTSKPKLTVTLQALIPHLRNQHSGCLQNLCFPRGGMWSLLTFKVARQMSWGWSFVSCGQV